MKQTPNWLIEKQITLPNGEEALWSYDTESDFLEVFFRKGPASATIELADGVAASALIAKKQSHLVSDFLASRF